MRTHYKKRNYYQSQNKPQPWPIDYNNGELVETIITSRKGQGITVNLTYIHSCYLAWLQKTERFDAHIFIAELAHINKPDDLDKVIQKAIIRLYINRESHNLRKPDWLSPLR